MMLNAYAGAAQLNFAMHACIRVQRAFQYLLS